ncbi:hypothetical protein BJ878DRAFT_442629 [Calycina marina]|uniref:Zn(2)-C6 fungal-type domain-containing protein n=1 Tax=Calycina marina TaxID=1763456 RepID=A0A9P8CFW5_9HELO|nr:hypothetical protein BJ878DRAFT_442629 [Calycina marina]
MDNTQGDSNQIVFDSALLGSSSTNTGTPSSSNSHDVSSPAPNTTTTTTTTTATTTIPTLTNVGSGRTPHAVGKPRRPHHKSRTGCMQCKQRKVKCDETKPMCKKCRNHNQSCSYLQTHPMKRGPPTVQSMLASPSPTSSTPNSAIPYLPQHSSSSSSQPRQPANFTMLDLEILHHWTTRSVESFVDFDSCVDLFRITVVDMGLEYPFLMHEILALTALHMSKVRPHKATIYQLAARTHLDAGLAMFQPEMANLNAQNCHACWAFSTMVFTHMWASQDPGKPSQLFFAPPVNIFEDTDQTQHVKWIQLHRGSLKMLRDLFPSLREGPLLPLFEPWKGMDPVAKSPLSPDEVGPLTELSNAWANSHRDQAYKDILSAAAASLCRVFSLLTYNPKISKLSAVMSWFSNISDEFLKMLEDKHPEALLIVAYYCVALKRADNMWWVREKPENLLRTVMTELLASTQATQAKQAWDRWMEWPKSQVLPGGSGPTCRNIGAGSRFGKVMK